MHSIHNVFLCGFVNRSIKLLCNNFMMWPRLIYTRAILIPNTYVLHASWFRNKFWEKKLYGMYKKYNVYIFSWIYSPKYLAISAEFRIWQSKYSQTSVWGYLKEHFESDMYEIWWGILQHCTISQMICVLIERNPGRNKILEQMPVSISKATFF